MNGCYFIPPLIGSTNLFPSVSKSLSAFFILLCLSSFLFVFLSLCCCSSSCPVGTNKVTEWLKLWKTAIDLKIYPAVYTVVKICFNLTTLSNFTLLHMKKKPICPVEGSGSYFPQVKSSPSDIMPLRFLRVFDTVGRTDFFCTCFIINTSLSTGTFLLALKLH